MTLLSGDTYADIILSFDNVQRTAGMSIMYVVNLVHVDTSSGVTVSTMSTNVNLEAPGRPLQ